MASQSLGLVLQHIRSLVGGAASPVSSDGKLLERFVMLRDEGAFAALVEEYGPMVLRVCRAVLRDGHEAEDASQATFLVLARRAGSLDCRRPLGGWLHAVAARIAAKARANAAKRRRHEREAMNLPREEPGKTSDPEQQALLHAELQRLPDKYRVPLVLCYLQGKTHEQAARELGRPVGSMSGHLGQGVELLRKRLIRRGMTVATSVLVAMLVGYDAKLRLWEVDTGKERRLFQGHELPVHSVALSPDERYAASASGSIWEHQDNSVRVWNVATGKELRKFTAHQNVVVSVGFSPDGKVLASASEDGTTLIWDMSALGSARQTRMKILSASELESLWKELASDDAAKAYEAIQTLTAAPAQAEAFLRTRLKPVAAENPKQVRQWIADLDSDRFAVRTKAVHELENLGEQVESALRIVLDGKSSPESRRQIESLLKGLDQSPSGNRLRELRAVEILEHLGTIESQRLLRTLAGGAVAARLSQEAKASLNRLDRDDLTRPALFPTRLHFGP